MRCPYCRREYPDTITVCPSDGRRLERADGTPLVETTLDGKYRLLDVLGSGGLGAVHRARRIADDTLVAVKVRHNRGVPPSELERFQREAALAALVRHPNVVAVLDSGTTSDGVDYLVMELLRGPSLADELAREAPFSLERTLDLLRPVALAVAEAHVHGLVHRDLKPSNVVLHRPSPDDEIVKVVDFGLAKCNRKDERTGTDAAESGWILGTPEYMSPEQVLGHSADARSDIYSFGVMMFELLTGKLPFAGDSVSSVLLMQVSESAPYLRRSRPDLPPTLEAFILRLLGKLPDQRPATMREALDEFETICGKWVHDRKAAVTLIEPSIFTAESPPKSSALASQYAPTLVATLLDVPTAWELDERETLSGCLLRVAFLKRLENQLAATASTPETPLGCLILLEFVGWEAFRSKSPFEQVEQALRRLGEVLRDVCGHDTLLGHFSESRWLVALPVRGASSGSLRTKVQNAARKTVLELHRVIQRDALLGETADLSVRAGGTLYRAGDTVDPLLATALERLQRARKDRQATLLLGSDTETTGPLNLSDFAFPLSRTSELMLASKDEAVPPPPGLVPRFVGRAAELERLKAAFQQNLRGNVRPAWIFGDPGIGKTDLVRQFERNMSAQDIFFVREAFHGLGGRPALQPFHQAVRNLLLKLVEEVPDGLPSTFGTLADKIGADFLDDEFFGGFSGESSDAFQLRGETVKLAHFEYLARVLTTLTHVRPVVLCLDDAHSATPLGLEFVSYLSRAVAGERFFLMCAFRRPDVDRSDNPVKLWLRQMQRIHPGETLSLEPLSLHEVRTLLETMLDGAPVSIRLVHRIFQETHGNPFHVIELARLLVAEGQVRFDGTRRHLADLGALPLPDSVRRQAEAILSGFDSDAADILAQAAVIGEHFSFELLAGITNLREATLLEILDLAVEQSLVVEDESVPDGYRFPLPLIRRVLAERVSSRRRKRLHQQVAELIETLYAGRAFWTGILAAHHVETSDHDATWRTATRAGRTAQRSPHPLAFINALQYFEWSQEALKSLDRERRDDEAFASMSIEDVRLRVRFHLDYGATLHALGMVKRAANQFAEAEELAEKAGADDLVAHSVVAKGRLWGDLGDAPSALEAGYQGLALLMQAEDMAGILLALSLTASANHALGRYPLALDQYQQALVRARESGNTNAQAQVWRGLALVQRSLGKYAEALKSARAAMELSRRERGQREMTEVRLTHHVLGVLLADLGQFDKAFEHLHAALSGARRGGWLLAEARTLIVLADLHLRCAENNLDPYPTTSNLSMPPVLVNLNAAKDHLNQAQRLAVQIGDQEAQGQILPACGRLFVRRGDLRTALEILQQGLSLVRNLELPELEAETYLALGRIRHRLGQFAVGMFERALAITRKIGNLGLTRQALLGLAEIAEAQGEREKRQARLDEARAILDDMKADLPEDLKEAAFGE